METTAQALEWINEQTDHLKNYISQQVDEIKADFVNIFIHQYGIESDRATLTKQFADQYGTHTPTSDELQDAASSLDWIAIMLQQYNTDRKLRRAGMIPPTLHITNRLRDESANFVSVFLQCFTDLNDPERIEDAANDFAFMLPKHPDQLQSDAHRLAMKTVAVWYAMEKIPPHLRKNAHK